MRVAVLAYVAVIATMVALALGTLGAGGSSILAVSLVFCACGEETDDTGSAFLPPAAAVGESLLPFGTRVLEEMGVSMEGFQVKLGL